MTLRIPDKYASSLAEFLRLSPQELAKFLDILRDEEPSLAVSRLTDTISARLSIERSRVNETIRLLQSLQAAREGLGTSVEEFVSELRAAMEASGKEELQPADWAAFQKAITDALSENALSVSSKAWEVIREHSHVYCSARVLTDLRPIFKNEVEQAPSAFVAVHTLKLVYHQDGKHHDFYVALDRSDIEQLATVLQRALSKEQSLRALTSAKGVKILDEVIP